MSHWDIRSFWRNRRPSAGRIRHAARGNPAALAEAAGEAALSMSGYRRPRLAAPARSSVSQIEVLEGRVLLSGDHPSYNQVFGVGRSARR